MNVDGNTMTVESNRKALDSKGAQLLNEMIVTERLFIVTEVLLMVTE